MLEKIKKRIKFTMILLIFSFLCYVFVPLGWYYFMTALFSQMNNGTERESIQQHFYTKIAGLTYVNGNFLLFMTKPYMFQNEYGYIYVSNNSQKWTEAAKFGWLLHFGSGPSIENDQVNFPMALGQSCYSYGNNLFSSNCKDNWQIETVEFFEQLKVWGSHKFIKELHEPTCYNPLKYKSSIVKVYSIQPPRINGYEVKDTTQLIPDYARLYQTFDGKHWHELVATREVINDLVLENNLQPNKLLDRYNNYRFPDLDFDKIIPVAYDIPCFPDNNLKAYEQLVKIIESNKLKIKLDKGLTAYGNGIYLGIFKNQQNHYSVISSVNGKDYTVSDIPNNIVYSLAGFVYKTY